MMDSREIGKVSAIVIPNITTQPHKIEKIEIMVEIIEISEIIEIMSITHI